jgi:hypothetical protein
LSIDSHLGVASISIRTLRAPRQYYIEPLATDSALCSLEFRICKPERASTERSLTTN